jgi:ATP-dependent DNA helicase DinG
VSDLHELLAAAVAAVGGHERPGQVAMAQAVQHTFDSEDDQHLLVQAGTGTGKSLAYLVPALARRKPVVVATATLALQAQIVGRDLPRTVQALEPLLGRSPTYAILKGRSNYACLHRVNEGVPDEQGELVQVTPTSGLGREVRQLHTWVRKTETGDRDDLDFAASDRAWAQVSVSARECLGASRCRYGQDCFAEQARDAARGSDVVVTNHALLAIDALESRHILPEHDAVVIDEAHELVARVTGVATDDLTAYAVEKAARRCRPHVDDEAADALLDAGEHLRETLDAASPGRIDSWPPEVAAAVRAVRDAAHRVTTAFAGERERGDGDDEAVRRQARVDVESVLDVAERLLSGDEHDVAWIEERERFGNRLVVAPLSVAGLLRTTVFSERSVVLTSATLKLGGSFDALAGSMGLTGNDAPSWTGIDVGSPFSYDTQGILYVARHLPTPGRNGIGTATLDELTDLVAAAGGRTLGLFSSRRAAEKAAADIRERLDLPVLCQGEDALGELVRRFAAEPRSSLFGTLGLWQGVDVPGPSLQLVVIDRIPFPRPDDPLMSARQRAVDEAGGNGFMAVAASHAALLLAQGSGRLIRTLSDRGVVAVLDPRLATARYGQFLRASLPPYWYTTDAAQVRKSLVAIDVTED